MRVWRLAVGIFSFFFSAVPFFENRYFAFSPFEKAVDIFLVRQYNNQCNRDGKYPVGSHIIIENEKYQKS